MSNLGHWDRYHEQAQPKPYGDPSTYALGARWLQGCELVEDWGCGLGWARFVIPSGRYWGLDGSQGPAVDEVVDLTIYRSRVPGIFMRHVLEHNLEWSKVLDNAVSSFTQRMALILFTPMADRTHQIAWNEGYEVPDISFSAKDLESRFGDGVNFRVEDLHTTSQYGVERIYYLEKS